MNRTLRPLAISVGLWSVIAAFAARDAAAQEANGFGEKGELIVTADRLLPLFSYTNQTITANLNGQERKISDSSTSMVLLLGREPNLTVNPHAIPRVAIDYSIIDHLTLGGSFVVAFGLGGTHQEEIGNSTLKADAPRATLVGFAPRVGYVLPLGHVFAFWPRAGLAFYSVSLKRDTTPNNGPTTTVTDTDSSWSVDLDPQFAWVPLQHFFVHFGPIMNIPFAGSRSSETVVGGTTNTTKTDLGVFHFGLSAGLGGWFDL